MLKFSYNQLAPMFREQNILEVLSELHGVSFDLESNKNYKVITVSSFFKNFRQSQKPLLVTNTCDKLCTFASDNFCVLYILKASSLRIYNAKCELFNFYSVKILFERILAVHLPRKNFRKFY